MLFFVPFLVPVPLGLSCVAAELAMVYIVLARPASFGCVGVAFNFNLLIWANVFLLGYPVYYLSEIFLSGIEHGILMYVDLVAVLPRHAGAAALGVVAVEGGVVLHACFSVVFHNFNQ